MNTQPEALRLAELLETDGWFPNVAAELRRLYEVNQMLMEALVMADAQISGANMNLNVLKKKVYVALTKAKEQA